MKVLSFLAVTLLVVMSTSSSNAAKRSFMGFTETSCTLSIPMGDMIWLSDVSVSNSSVAPAKEGATSRLTKSGEEYTLFVRDTLGRSDEFTFKTNVSATLTNTKIGVDCIVL